MFGAPWHVAVGLAILATFVAGFLWEYRRAARFRLDHSPLPIKRAVTTHKSMIFASREDRITQLTVLAGLDQSIELCNRFFCSHSSLP
jgi:hypothetical protein